MLFRSLILPTIFLAACATSTTQSPSNIPNPTPPRLLQHVRIDTSLLADSDRVPGFSTTPLVAWGPAPAGTVHPEPPRRYDLQHQIISVRFDWSRHAVIGSTTLRIAALDAPLDTINLDAMGMKIKRVVAVNSGPVTYTYDDTTLAIHPLQPFPPHAVTLITVDYEVVKPKKGVYFIDRVHYLWTQGETDDNRYWVPTYDHPDDKTTWEINVITDPDERALSNGRLVSSKRVPEGIQWSWSLDKPASTYLMSIATGKYTVIKDHWKDIPVDYWVYPDTVEAGRRGFVETPKAIDFYSKKLGVPYPWPKYDQSVVPDFIFGGMENVTCTTQNDQEILFPAWAAPTANLKATQLVAHELAHQWFGDLLTTKTWAHVWLNEGFATFMEQAYSESAYGADEGAIERLRSQQQTINADRRGRRPIVYDRWENDPIELFFSGHIYPKGALVLQMLRHKFGDALFWASMHRYVVEHEYQNVVTDDLRQAFEETTHQNLKPFFDQWVYGAGFPVFQVDYSYDPVTRQLTLLANEVQPRDSLTGYFDADVDIEARTGQSVVHGVVPVRNGTGEIVLTLDGPPLSIQWNKGKWLLAVSDFPRPSRMLMYQLRHDDDVLGRLEAIELLKKQTNQPAVVQALGHAANADEFWSVRRSAVVALTLAAPDMSARRVLLTALRDRDARVRQAAATALATFPDPTTSAALVDVIQHDPSLTVRGEALAAYLTVAGDAALPTATKVMATPSWQNVLRGPALQVLAKMPSKEAQALYHQYAQ
ncbi:MAG TPA: M1 family metallopeptidase [Gemmatimonadaceae bacterium]|jgi:aminopeptidase N|nr:M1 family metallopeptidase [Gemmatimonadaceae bacterium]